MRLLQDVPIQQKLTRIAVLATGVAILLVGVALVSYELLRSRSLMTREMIGMADIIGAHSAAAVVSKGFTAAEETLAALDVDSRIDAARIYTKQGRIVATYLRNGLNQDLLPATLPADGASLRMGSLTLVQPILLGRERIGTLYIRSNMERLYGRLREGLFIMIGVLLVSSLLAVFLSSRLRGMITQPVQHLAQIVMVVTEKNDYSVRAVRFGQDELGLLTDGFNEMLARIQARGAALQEVRDQLEERVTLRTQELELDIAARRQAEEKLERSQGQLRALAAYLEVMQEHERTAIAREIHDDLGQMLTALKIDLSWVANRLSHEQTALREKIRMMHTLLDSLIESVRRLAAQLRPSVLDDLGLVAAIEWQAQEFHRRTGVACEFTATLEEHEMDSDLCTAVFRILQEALTNVVRHAHATRVTIHLAEEAGCLYLTVADNGRGITSQDLGNKHSLGLLGMRERAHLLRGEVRIVGSPAAGTTVIVRMPLLR